MKHIFIVNPVAGSKDYLDLVSKIYEVCKKNKVSFEIIITKNIGDATEKAKLCASQNEKCVVYSVGGDGTLNEVVNGIALTDTILGVIPTGSGNDFFRMLSNYKKNIFDRTINGSIENMNIGKVNDRYFSNIASVGYDAEVAVNAFLMKEKKYVPNHMIYYASIFYTLMSFKSPHIRIEFNDMTLEQQITLLAICNGAYYGNGIQIAPNAKYDDDLFNICLIDKVSKIKIPYLLTKLLKAEHEKYNVVHTFKTDYIKVEADQYLNCNVDGEIMKSDKFEFAIVKNKMKVLKPKKTTY